MGTDSSVPPYLKTGCFLPSRQNGRSSLTTGRVVEPSREGWHRSLRPISDGGIDRRGKGEFQPQLTFVKQSPELILNLTHVQWSEIPASKQQPST